jgi:hypothetical protein
VHNRELDLAHFLFGSHLGHSGVPSIYWINQDAVFLILFIRQAACMISSDPVGHHFVLMKEWLMFVL